MVDPNALTLAGLLQDPLTRMVMRSDGVTETDLSNLMLRVKDCLLARQETLSSGQRRVPVVVNGPDCGIPAHYDTSAHFPETAIYQF
jgi:hypothetical protein